MEEGWGIGGTQHGNRLLFSYAGVLLHIMQPHRHRIAFSLLDLILKGETQRYTALLRLMAVSK